MATQKFYLYCQDYRGKSRIVETRYCKRRKHMIPIAIRSEIALAAVLLLMTRSEHRRMRSVAAGKRRVPNANAIGSWRAPKKGAGTGRIVIENELCKHLRG